MPVEPLSVITTGAAERAFANEPFLRRLAKLAQLEADSKVLQLAAGDGSMGLLLAQTLRCKVTVVVGDTKLRESLEQRARALSLGERLKTRAPGDDGSVPVDGKFRAVLAAGPLPGTFGASAAGAREHLEKDGRLCHVCLTRVGLGTPADVWARAWEGRLGEALLTPIQLLGALEKAGFEPETVETLTETELEGVVKLASPGSEEAALYVPLPTGPRATVAVAIGRRKEPNEKPPTSGDRG